jgi:molybdopterin biosynthesis enzyme
VLTVDQALDLLLTAAQPLADLETIDTLAATGRVLAKAVVSAVDVPPMDNSQMDGYALRVRRCSRRVHHAADLATHCSRACGRAAGALERLRAFSPARRCRRALTRSYLRSAAPWLTAS